MRELIEKLKLGADSTVKWVLEILNERWKAHGKTRGERRHSGIKFRTPRAVTLLREGRDHEGCHHLLESQHSGTGSQRLGTRRTAS